MATTTTLNTRIKLRYDTLSNWQSKNPILLKGEVAVVEVPANGVPEGKPVDDTGSYNYRPTILFKVGKATSTTESDATTYGFNALPWASGLAADVYSWAKKTAAETGDGMKVTGFTPPGQDDDFVDLTSKNNASLNSVIQDIYNQFNSLTGGNGSIETQINNKLDALVANGTNDTVSASANSYVTGIKIDEDANGVRRLTLTEAALPNYSDPSAAATAVTPDGSTTVDVITNISQTNGAISATKKTLSFGDAAQKGVFSGTLATTTTDTTLPTAAQVATFVKDSVADLAGATHFRGVVSTAPSASVTDGPLDTPATYTVGTGASAETVNYVPGDIIIYNSKEYIMDTSNHWIELGDESAYVLKEENKRLMTAAEGLKLAGIEEGAEVNEIDDIKISSTDGTTSTSATITNKTITLGALAGKNVITANDLGTDLANDINGKLDAVDATIASLDTTDTNVVKIKAGLEETSSNGTNTVTNTSDTDITLSGIATTGYTRYLSVASGDTLILDGGNAD